jgi:hypothetical protein
MTQAKKKALVNEAKLITALDTALFKLNRLYNDPAFFKKADLKSSDQVAREYSVKEIDLYIGDLIHLNDQNQSE